MQLTPEDSKVLTDYIARRTELEAMVQNLQYTSNPTREQQDQVFDTLLRMLPKVIPVLDLLLIRTGLIVPEDRHE